jgi:hypothetical protein
MLEPPATVIKVSTLPNLAQDVGAIDIAVELATANSYERLKAKKACCDIACQAHTDNIKGVGQGTTYACITLYVPQSANTLPLFVEEIDGAAVQQQHD